MALFLAFVGPWVAMAIAGVLTAPHERAILMAGPSPTFAVVMAEAIRTAAPEHGLIQLTGCACAVAWGLLGLGSFAAASLRVNKRLHAAAEAQKALQTAFDAEERVLTQGPLVTTVTPNAIVDG